MPDTTLDELTRSLAPDGGLPSPERLALMQVYAERALRTVATEIERGGAVIRQHYAVSPDEAGSFASMETVEQRLIGAMIQMDATYARARGVLVGYLQRLCDQQMAVARQQASQASQAAPGDRTT